MALDLHNGGEAHTFRNGSEFQSDPVPNFPLDSIEHDVALYHDHLEDGLGAVPEHVRSHVELLTRHQNEPYKTYIERIVQSGDAVAVAVKLADARDNLSRCWGANDGYLNPNLARRYEYVIEQLGDTTE